MVEVEDRTTTEPLPPEPTLGGSTPYLDGGIWPPIGEIAACPTPTGGSAVAETPRICGLVLPKVDIRESIIRGRNYLKIYTPNRVPDSEFMTELGCAGKFERDLRKKNKVLK